MNSGYLEGTVNLESFIILKLEMLFTLSMQKAKKDKKWLSEQLSYSKQELGELNYELKNKEI